VLSPHSPDRSKISPWANFIDGPRRFPGAEVDELPAVPALAMDAGTHIFCTSSRLEDVLYGPCDIEAFLSNFPRARRRLISIRCAASPRRQSHPCAADSRGSCSIRMTRGAASTDVWIPPALRPGGAELADGLRARTEMLRHGSLQPLTDQLRAKFRLAPRRDRPREAGLIEPLLPEQCVPPLSAANKPGPHASNRLTSSSGALLEARVAVY